MCGFCREPYERSMALERDRAEAELKDQLARLEKTHAGDHRGFIESRRVLNEYIEALEGQIRDLKAQVKALGG